MDDTSELLRLCERVIDTHNGTPCDEIVVAIALKSRLQAEAPEDAEVAEIEKRDAQPIPLSLTNREFTRLLSQAESDRRTLLAKLRARTSQAEAQALTCSACGRELNTQTGGCNWCPLSQGKRHG